MRKLLFLSLLLAACRIDSRTYFEGDGGSDDGTYSVGGTVEGMWDGASVSLRLEAADVDEVLNVSAEGTFTFETELPEQTAFTVTVDVQPDLHTCTVEGAGMIDDVDIETVTVACAGPVVDVALSAPIPWSFDMATASYDLDVSTLIQETAVTVMAPDATAIRLDGTDLIEGAASAPVALAIGANTLAVEVVVGDLQRTFTIVLDRGAAAIQQYLFGKASNTDAGDEFATALAMSGDTLVVGAPFEDSNSTGINGPQGNDSTMDSGAVYVLRRTGETWHQEAYLKPSRTYPGDRFGESVAIDGDTLVVGAPFEDGQGLDIDDSGAAYVFRRTGTSWAQEGLLRAAGNTADAQFGSAVAIDADVAVVGAPQGGSAGRAYVFRRTGTSWAEEKRLPEVEQFPGLVAYGVSVSVSETLLVVGQPGENYVYAYRWDGLDWELEEDFTVPATGSGAVFFGMSVIASGDTIIVAAPGDPCACRGIDPPVLDDTATYSGAVYVYRRAGGAWVQEAFIKSSNSDASDGFSGFFADTSSPLVLGFLSGMAFHDEHLVVGASWEASASSDMDDNSLEGAGAAYVFRRTGTTWIQERFLKASNPGSTDHFGVSVTASTNGMVVGAFGEDTSTTGLGGVPDEGEADSGAIYIFR